MGSLVSRARNKAKPSQQLLIVTEKEAEKRVRTSLLASHAHGRVLLEGTLQHQQPPAPVASAALPWVPRCCHAASGTADPHHPCLKLHLLLAAELRDFNLLITL